MTENEQTQQEGHENDPDWLKTLRQKARDYDKELPELKKELAISKSGIKADTPVGKLFLKAYEGEWETDALVEAAKEYKEYGLFEDSQTQSQQPAQEQPASGQKSLEDEFKNAAGAMQRMDAVSSTQTQDTSDWNLDEARSATSPEEFMAKYKGPILSDG